MDEKVLGEVHIEIRQRGEKLEYRMAGIAGEDRNLFAHGFLDLCSLIVKNPHMAVFNHPGQHIRSKAGKDGMVEDISIEDCDWESLRPIYRQDGLTN